MIITGGGGPVQGRVRAVDSHRIPGQPGVHRPDREIADGHHEAARRGDDLLITS